MNIGKNKKNEVGLNAGVFTISLAVLVSIGILLGNLFLLEISFFIFALHLGLNGGLKALMYFTLFTFLQNIFLIIFSSYLSNVGSQLIILSKELIVYCSLIVLSVNRVYMMKAKSMDWGRTVLILFSLFMLYSFFTSSASVSIKIISLRQISIPFVCLFFGYSLNMPERTIWNYLRRYDYLIVIFCIAGICIYMMPISFWDTLDYADYYVQKNGTEFDGKYVNFISNDFGMPLKRFVSITADPIASAHLIGISLLGIILTHKKMSLFSLLIVLCSVLTYSKSLIFLVVVTVLVYFYSILKKDSSRFFFILFSSIGLVFIFGFAESYVANLSANTATGNHLNSLFYALNNISLLGNGLGTAGFNVIINGGIIDASEATESFFAIMMVQSGLIGTVLFYSYLLLIVKKLFILYRIQQNVLVLFSIILLLDILLESVVSGSSVAMLGTSLYFIIPGIILRCYSSKTGIVM